MKLKFTRFTLSHSFPNCHTGFLVPVALFAAGLICPLVAETNYNDGDHKTVPISTSAAGDIEELNLSSGYAIQAAEISGAGGVSKVGAGELELAVENTFSGGLTITEGLISFHEGDSRADGALGAAGGAVTLNGGQLHSGNLITLDPTRLITIGANGGALSGNLTINQTIVGTGSLSILNHGYKSQVILGGLQNYAGATVVDGSELTITGTHNNSGGMQLVNSGYLQVGIAGSLENAAHIGGQVDVVKGSISFHGSAYASGTINSGLDTTRQDTGNNELYFNEYSSAGTAVINNKANSTISFWDNATAGSATINNDGGVVEFLYYFDSASPTASQATVVNNASSSITTVPSGYISIDGVTTLDRTFAIGHLTGSGNVYLGNNTLVIGGLDERSMIISGTISYGDHMGYGGVLGGIRKIGESTLTLAATNHYYGATTVSGGKLELSATNAIAHSALVEITNNATFAIMEDNKLWNLTGDSSAATLELAAATTTTLYNTPAENIDSDNNGAIVTISTGNTIYAGRIIGEGAINKTGPGILTLNGANTYTGATTVTAGVLQIGDASHQSASITSNVTISDGATLAGYGRVIGNVVNNGTISFGDAFEEAHFRYSGFRTGNLTQSFVTAATTGNYTIQGSLTNNNLLKLGRVGGLPGNVLTITESYAGNGVVRLNTDLSSGKSDRLIVLGNASGNLKFMIGDIAPVNERITDDTVLDIATLSSATNATFSLVDNTQRSIDYIEAGMLTFQLANAGNTLQLLSHQRQSHAADAILATASVAGAEWHYDLDNLSKRLGELRFLGTTDSDPTASNTGNIWLRASSYRLNADESLAGASFHEYVNALTGGIDFAHPTSSGMLYLGAFVGMGRVDRSFDNHGDGNTSNVGLGLYATLITPACWYLDFVAKCERNKNDFSARAVDGRTTNGEYTSKNEVLSLEIGRQIRNASGWWVEPGAQIAIAWLGGNDYTTTGAAEIDVHIDNTMAAQYRFQVRAGKHTVAGRWNPYIKFAAAKNDSDSAEITAWGKTYARDCDGWRAEAGAGVSYQINSSSHVYFDYEYAKASNYERPYSMNLGYRRAW